LFVVAPEVICSRMPSLQFHGRAMAQEIIIEKIGAGGIRPADTITASFRFCSFFLLINYRQYMIAPLFDDTD